MKDGDIDYSSYTLREMEEAFEGIDAARFPLNYANLRLAYARLEPGRAPPPPRETRVEPVDESEPPPTPRYDDRGRYVPNHIPAGERGGFLAFSLLLLAYGSFGVWVNDLYLPAKRGGIHLHDAAAWIMFGAIACACLVMLLLVADHYDRRDNELDYWRVGRTLRNIGWLFFVLSLLVGALQNGRT